MFYNSRSPVRSNTHIHEKNYFQFRIPYVYAGKQCAFVSPCAFYNLRFPVRSNNFTDFLLPVGKQPNRKKTWILPEQILGILRVELVKFPLFFHKINRFHFFYNSKTVYDQNGHNAVCEQNAQTVFFYNSVDDCNGKYTIHGSYGLWSGWRFTPTLRSLLAFTMPGRGQFTLPLVTCFWGEPWHHLKFKRKATGGVCDFFLSVWCLKWS